ncbi:MAG: Flp pilus assembly protein CpaB [Planctomycetes bacterium]|jgi:Flp pilus assembly protein CpaB|nr:Flp pilus assembly protein CpaB [Planctomycetota bacterium]
MSQSPTPGVPGAPAQSQNSTRLVVIALIVALAAVILVNIYIEVARSQAAGGSIIVYRVNRSLEPGDEIAGRDLEAVEVPDKFEDTFDRAVRRNPDTGNAEKIGETLMRPIDENDVLTYDHFIDDPQDKLISKIEPGKRLIALPVEAKILPSVRPGMKVDIEAPFAGGGKAPEVLTVMENVQVLATGQRTIIEEQREEDGSRRRTNFDTISIQVTPEQATQLSRIQKITTGPFELHIRPADDESRPKIPGGGINPDVLQKIGEDPAEFGS